MGLTTDWDSVGLEVRAGHYNEPNPMRALALAVIQQAIADVETGAGTTEIERGRARSFLFSKDGEWAAARRAWCSEADINEYWLKRRLEKLPADVPNYKRRIEKQHPTRERYEKWLTYLRERGWLDKVRPHEKTLLSNILNDAGFRAARGGPLKVDSVTGFMDRHSDLFKS